MVGLASTTPIAMLRRRCSTVSEGSARTSATCASGASGPILVLAAALAAGTVAQGAYYGAGQRIVAVLLLIAVTAAGWARRWRWVELRSGVVMVVVAISLWLVVRSSLAGKPAAAVSVVALSAGVVVVMLLCRRATSAERDTLGDIAVAVATLAAVSAWAGVAWRLSRWVVEDPGLWRGAGTLTYPNATAGLLVPVVLFACCRNVGRPARPVIALSCCVLMTGIGATLSRGGLLALAAGALTAAVLVGWRRFVAVAAPPAAGAVVAVAGLVPSFAAGSSPRPGVAVAALCCGLALTWWASRPNRTAWAGVGLGVVLAAAVAAVAAAVSLGALDVGRVSLTSPDRVGAMRAALGQVAQHPLIGVGPDTAFTWHSDDHGVVLGVRYVHNEYLQVLAEYGAVGVVLVVALLVAVAWTIARPLTGRPWPGARAGVTAGLVALGLHSALDFLWHVPIIPLIAAVLVGLIEPIPKEE